MEYAEVIEKRIGDYTITLSRLPETAYWGTVAPWRFSISKGADIWTFTGVPNYCTTKKSAMSRARWRVKWLLDGTYNRRYRSL